MAMRQIPKPVEADYPHWRRLFGRDVPATFSLWLADIDGHYRDDNEGNEEVPVDPLEFEAYCRATGATPGRESLDRYMQEVTNRNRKPSLAGTMTGRVD